MNEYRHRRIDGVLVHAHRAAWEEAHGPIPEGMIVHHKCGDKSCVDLDHLQLVTRREHALIHRAGDAMARIKREQTHCVHGHPFDETNTYIRRRPEGGRQCRACAANTERERRRKRREARQSHG